MSSVKACLGLLKMEFSVFKKQPMPSLMPVFFGFLVTLMFPLGLGPSPQTLAALAPGLLWVIALLACLLSIDQMFQQEFNDASLVLWLHSPNNSYFLILTKIFAHWCSRALPLVIFAPVFALMLYLPQEALPALLASLLLGSLALIFIGAIGSALTVSLQNSTVLLALIILPLYVPVLILSIAAVNAASQGLPSGSYLSLLAALALLAVVLAPLGVWGGLRINIDAS